MIYVNFKKLTETAIMPTKATKGSAAYDLCVDEIISVGIPPGQTVMLKTGIAAEIPDGYAGFVFSRSGTSIKKGLRIATGVSIIDADYRGNIGIPLHNHTDVIQMVAPQERVAQIIIQRVEDVLWHEVAQLSETERGTGGFGSTGT